MHSEHENTEGIVAPSWWTEVNPTHSEYEIVNNDKIVDMVNANVWRDLDMSWPDPGDDAPTGNTIVFADVKRNETE
jgi:hypothetical protein